MCREDSTASADPEEPPSPALVIHLMTLMYISTRTHHSYQSSLCLIRLLTSIIHRTRPRSVGYYRRPAPVLAASAVAAAAVVAEFVV